MDRSIGLSFDNFSNSPEVFEKYLVEVFEKEHTPLKVSFHISDEKEECTIFMPNADIIKVHVQKSDQLKDIEISINDDTVYKEEAYTIHYNKEMAEEVHSLYLQYLEEHGV